MQQVFLMDIKKIFEQINGKNYIAGNWLSEKEIIQVDNPSSGEIIGYVPNLSKKNLLKAINNTCQMAKLWAASTAMAFG
jgi:succinate-semialdehyde dehydrogenase/glutarate-semialdehyde dehydrogenase